jgi:hypothetical protein
MVEWSGQQQQQLNATETLCWCIQVPKQPAMNLPHPIKLFANWPQEMTVVQSSVSNKSSVPF